MQSLADPCGTEKEDNWGRSHIALAKRLKRKPKIIVSFSDSDESDSGPKNSKKRRTDGSEEHDGELDAALHKEKSDSFKTPPTRPTAVPALGRLPVSEAEVIATVKADPTYQAIADNYNLKRDAMFLRMMLQHGHKSKWTDLELELDDEEKTIPVGFDPRIDSGAYVVAERDKDNKNIKAERWQKKQAKNKAQIKDSDAV